MVNFFAEWIKMDERNDIAMSNWFGFCGRTNQHCMFWLSKLYITCVRKQSNTVLSVVVALWVSIFVSILRV